jgi:isopenicillin N synthase-like dioxygenase
MGPPDDTEYPTAFPPESVLPGFSDFMKVKYYRLQEVATQLMGALEIGLGLPPNALTQKCEPVNSELRFNHYPPLQATSRQGGLRSVGHTDLGVLTLLFADGVAGLEFENRATGAFEMVETRGSQEMLVNVSDTLERWTNGVLRGGLHRVSGTGVGDQSVMPTRRSIVFFYKADMQSGSGPLEEFVSEKNPARYDDVTVDEFLRRMNARLYK